MKEAGRGYTGELCGQCVQKPVLHKNLGIIYSRTGHIAKAEQELRLALRWKPNDQEALSTVNIFGATSESS
jgi:Flp pilus assembly protein TadD